MLLFYTCPAYCTGRGHPGRQADGREGYGRDGRQPHLRHFIGEADDPPTRQSTNLVPASP